MIGAVIIVIALLAIPVAICMSGPIVAAALGWSLAEDAEERHEGSELIALNR